MAIPIIDFVQSTSGDIQSRRSLAAQIDSAFQDFGFVYLLNHGIPEEKVKRCFEMNKMFFDLPEDIKQLAPHPPGGSHHRGYSGLGVEKVSQHEFDPDVIEALRKVPDVKESFESGNVNDILQPNIWLPEQNLPGFRVFMESFFDACQDLIHRILRILAIALELPSQDYLSSSHSQSLFQLRLLHYPAISSKLLNDLSHSRIQAHSDFGTLTLLFQDNVGGLEIQDPHGPGKFIEVVPVENAVLVNIGDLMERWSNSRWKSTVHRVVAPSVSGEAMSLCPDRYSVPFFATADPNTMIDALPGCWDADKPKTYEPMTAWEYVQMRMAALYKSSTQQTPA